jgi:hypothetical protein
MITLLPLGALGLWAILATVQAIRTDDYRRLPDRQRY